MAKLATGKRDCYIFNTTIVYVCTYLYTLTTD